MKKMILVGGMAAILFGASAGVSWYLKQRQAQHAEESAPPTTESRPNFAQRLKEAPSSTASTGSGGKPAFRPQFTAEGDGLAQISINLSKKSEELRVREQQLATRQKNVEMIFQDIKSERAVLDELRKQLAEESRATEQRIIALEQKAGENMALRDEVATKTKELDASRIKTETQEETELKRMATVFDLMAPDKAAATLQNMADGGSLETAVKVLSYMKERQAAKVLAEMTDPSVATQLFEKMKVVKRPVTPPARK